MVTVGHYQAFGVMALLLQLAGIAMLAHVALCAMLRALLRGNPELSSLVLLSPNSWLGNSAGPQLLRAKYFMPLARIPEEMNDESVFVRTTFLLARVSGSLVPVLLLAFLGYGIYLAGQV